MGFVSQVEEIKIKMSPLWPVLFVSFLHYGYIFMLYIYIYTWCMYVHMLKIYNKNVALLQTKNLVFKCPLDLILI